MKKGLWGLLFVASLCSKQKDLQKLVALNEVNPNIKIECMYATYKNFTGQRIYPKKFYKRTYLLKEVAQQLSKVQKELETQGLGLLVWDAFRPMEGQKKLWEVFPVEGFVAPPSKGGRHTRGTTVDLTIIKLSDGQPLTMGTGFDVFIPQSKAASTTISKEAQRNRKLLQTVMKKYGFTVLPTEWWHFDYKNIWSYPPLEVTFDDLN